MLWDNVERSNGATILEVNGEGLGATILEGDGEGLGATVLEFDEVGGGVGIGGKFSFSWIRSLRKQVSSSVSSDSVKKL